MKAQGFEVVGSGVAFVAGEAVLRVDNIPFFHAGVAMRFGKDGCGGDGNAARVAFDERFLLDQDIKLHSVNQQIIRLNGELLQRGSHGLAASLVNVPRVDALGIDFGDGPGDSVFANASSEFGAPFGGELFRIVETDNASLWIKNNRGGDNRPEERAAAGFIKTSDAHPAKLSRRSLETGRAEAAH